MPEGTRTRGRARTLSWTMARLRVSRVAAYYSPDTARLRLVLLTGFPAWPSHLYYIPSRILRVIGMTTSCNVNNTVAVVPELPSRGELPSRVRHVYSSVLL